MEITQRWLLAKTGYIVSYITASFTVRSWFPGPPIAILTKSFQKSTPLSGPHDLYPHPFTHFRQQVLRESRP